MFLTVTNAKSSSVDSLSINPGTRQAIVKYVGNDRPYLYTGVDFSGLYDLVYNQVDSIGKWVNTYCKAESVGVLTV